MSNPTKAAVIAAIVLAFFVFGIVALVKKRPDVADDIKNKPVVEKIEPITPADKK